VYPILFFDAIHYKVRKDGKISSKAAYVCLGINEDGIKEVLGISLVRMSLLHIGYLFLLTYKIEEYRIFLSLLLMD
jgi:hypothetical protein